MAHFGPMRMQYSCGHKTGDWKSRLAMLGVSTEVCPKCKLKEASVKA